MNNKQNRIIPELLAPAGGMKQLRAAVENGADAVYMGGKLFNARMNAENFEEDDFIEAIKYAHVRGVKIYITMNTLIADSVIKDALEYAQLLYGMGVDALIIQDLGFAALVKDNMPDLKIHLSTQGTVYNEEGVRAANKLGFDRVVLARETSLIEIKEITEKSISEIEVFVHGALCICYSGQCQMSFEIGGRSGNLGGCGQPCRLPYELFYEKNGLKKRVCENGCLLSPKDLALISRLDLLAEAGVSSLKIEGRMKSAEYVAVVTGIYRKYLDMYKREGSYHVTESDHKALRQIYSRGEFTEGYLTSNPGEKLMSVELSKHQGLRIGQVLGEGAVNDLVKVRLTDKLSIGDGVEIRNEYMPGNVVTYLKKGKNYIKSAQAGEEIVIGDIRGEIKKGDALYKITDTELMTKAAATFDGKNWEEMKALKKIEIDIYFSVSAKEGVSLKITDESGNEVKVELDSFQRSEHYMEKEKIVKQVSKTGGTPFLVRNCQVDSDHSLSFPVSAINGLRRQGLEKLSKLREKTALREMPIKNASEQIAYIYERHGENKPQKDFKCKILKSAYLFEENYFRKVIAFPEKLEYDLIYIPYSVFLKNIAICRELKAQIEIIPVISNVTKGSCDLDIKTNFLELTEAVKTSTAGSKISVGNLGWIEPFLKEGLNVQGDFGLNLYNSADFMLMKTMGVSSGVISHELPLEEMEKLCLHGIIPEVVVGGSVPVMISENKLFDMRESESGDAYYLKDRKGAFYRVLSEPDAGRTRIFSCKERKLLLPESHFANWENVICRRYLI